MSKQKQQKKAPEPIPPDVMREQFRSFLAAAVAAWGRVCPPQYRELHDRGEFLHGRKPVAEDRHARRFQELFRPRKKECWANAQSFALWAGAEGLDDYRYYEGMVSSCGVPIEHGYVVGPDGLPIDHTLEAAERWMLRNNIRPDPDRHYVGVAIPLPYVRRMWHAVKYTQPLAALWIAEGRPDE